MVKVKSPKLENDSNSIRYAEKSITRVKLLKYQSSVTLLVLFSVKVQLYLIKYYLLIYFIEMDALKIWNVTIAICLYDTGFDRNGTCLAAWVMKTEGPFNLLYRQPEHP